MAVIRLAQMSCAFPRFFCGMIRFRVTDTPIWRQMNCLYVERKHGCASITGSLPVSASATWTGGGIVDHRHGITYTLTLPTPTEGHAPHPQASVLYRYIHGALARALRMSGVECSLLTHDAPPGGRACWASPVASDIVDGRGHKLAGAGQRRYRGAVLHQGLIQQCSPEPGWDSIFAHLLSPSVTAISSSMPWSNFETELHNLCVSKYLSPAWEDESHGRRKPSEH